MTTHPPAKATRCAWPKAPRVASATNFLHHFRDANQACAHGAPDEPFLPAQSSFVAV